MKDYLILKLQGPMQAWGEHSFEGLRPSSFVPTRSAVLGLIGACLGVGREDRTAQAELADCFGLAVRIDRRRLPGSSERRLRQQKLTDYHTIKGARSDYRGLKSHDTIQTWREYLLDAEFSVALWERHDARQLVDKVEQAVKKPIFTPYLGRRSCPIARPLFEKRLKAEDEFSALNQVGPVGGEIYSETPGKVRSLKVRDVPMIHQPRQFTTRIVYVYGGEHVFK
jgi:CRISPR system Cascade subunit CasD